MTFIAPITVDQRHGRAISLRIADIQGAVCRMFMVTRIDMLSARKGKDIARPRQVAMYLAARWTRRSLPEIGRLFGGRDHTTISHGRNRIAALIQVDQDLKDKVLALEAMLPSLCACERCVRQADAFPYDPPQLLLPIAWPGELALEQRIAA